jgi:polyisoprenoid-binding protein YceI
VLALTRPAYADEHYTLDKTHTAIDFSVNSFFGLSEINGAFTKFEGDFVFCKEDPSEDRISVTLYSSGIHTLDGGRDEELQGPYFFNAAQFPDIRFVSTKVELTDENEATVDGDLTLLGVTKPITMRVHFMKKIVDPDSANSMADFTASSIIRRSDFGMTYDDPFIGNDVRLRIKANGADEFENDH